MRALLLLFFFAVTAVAEPVQISRVTPTGDEIEQDVRQIVLTFNQKMVALGDMKRTEKQLGISVSPAIICDWRWMDPSTLVCEISDENRLKLANRYTVTLKPGLKSAAGPTLATEFKHTFSTKAPASTYHSFHTWNGPTSPVIELSFNVEVEAGQVTKHVVFTSGGKTYPAKIFEEKNHPKNTHDEEDADDVPSAKVKKKAEADERWLVTPANLLPADKPAVLTILPGIKGNTGPLTGRKQDVVEFHTFPAFEFLGIECTPVKEGILKEESGRERFSVSGSAVCSPLGGVSLLFSTPVRSLNLQEMLKITPALARKGQEEDAWPEQYSEYLLRSPYKEGTEYRVDLPSFLMAKKNYKFEIAKGLKDEFNRPIKAAVNFEFRTGTRPPAMNVPHKVAVLEKEEKTEVPFYVTNIQSIDLGYNLLTSAGGKEGLHSVLKPSKVEDLAYAIPMEARKMAKGGSAVMYGSIQATPDVYSSVNDENGGFLVQITPFHVLTKLGHHNTTVWVTDMKSGKVVSGAKVEILNTNFVEMVKAPTVLDTAKTDGNGLATLKGRSEVDPEMKMQNNYRFGDDHLMVRVTKGDDIALLPITYDFNINNGLDYYSERVEKKWGHIHTWGTTAQGVYRVGDKVQFKIYVRDQDNFRFKGAPKADYALVVRDPTGQDAFKVDKLTLNEFGAYSGEFTIATTAPVGWYDFTLAADFPGELKNTWTPLKILVSDFTPIPFKVATELNGKRFGPNSKLKVSTAATMHSGGPYAKAPLRVNASFKPMSFQVDNPELNGFTFDEYPYGSTQIFQVEGEVDAKGRNEVTQEIKELSHTFGAITVESAVSDDRGMKVADSASAMYSGLDRRVGMKPADWVFIKGKPGKLLYAVVDEDGKMVEGTKVSIVIQHEEVKVAKVKGAGNAYLNKYEREWKDEGKCDGVSKKEPAACEFTPKGSGEYKFFATIQDTKGREQKIDIQAYSVGPGRALWYEGDENQRDSIPVIADRKDYKIGDTARFLVKNPIPGARALITIERFGVMKSWTKVFENSTETIEVKLDKDMVPGFFLSVALMSPRVEAAPGDGNVDLGKPTIRMGAAKVDVKDPYKIIEVTTKIPKDTYRPRDKVKVKLRAVVKNRSDKEPIELAVAVLDESVLAMIQGGTDYFDPYKGFYTLDGLDLVNYNTLVRLVGRQKFEKKGANAGGDGGLAGDVLERSLFKFVSYWNPSLKTNSSGEAEFEFTVPDNLTGWRVLAMAVTPTDRMGLGTKSFKVNKPTELRPAMPNQVTEGDQFKAEFSLMNRTDKPRVLDVTFVPQGLAQPLDPKAPLTMKVDLKAFERKNVGVMMKASRVPETRDVVKGEVAFKVTAKDALDSDVLVHKVPVSKRRSMDVAASYGSTEDAKVKEAVQFPKNIYTDSGSVTVTAAASVIGDLDGSFRFARNYPYECWEQKMTRSLFASQYGKLKAYIPTVTWDGASALPQDTLALAKNYQAPNGGMAYWVPTDDHVDPYLSAYTALGFQWLREGGYKVPADVEKKLHDYLKSTLKASVMPTFYDAGMESTVRAVSLYVLAKAKKIKGADVRRFQSGVKGMSLLGKAFYLRAAIASGEGEPLRKSVADLILAQGNQTAGKFMFNEKWEDQWERMLATPVRDNCAVLSGLVQYAGTPEGMKSVGDVPLKVMRSLTQSRGARDHFENTQENVFCMQAFVDYAKVYEATAPAYTVTAALDQKKFGEAEFTKFNDPLKTFTRPIEAADPGRKTEVTIEKKGPGRLYYSTRLSYAQKAEDGKAFNAGVDVGREYYVERGDKWIRLENKAQVKRGELVRVELYVSLPAARNFLVVQDPVPGGLEPVNRDLANTSKVDAKKGEFKPSKGSLFFKFGDWREFSWSFWSFYHKELRHDSARFYSDYLEPGNYRLTYTAQVIAPGEFQAAPAVAEEMYDPDVYGKSAPAMFTIAP